MTGPMDPAWVGFFPFHIGVLQGLADNISDLPTTSYPEIKRCIVDAREVLDRIEKSIDLMEVPF